ncbi:MAG TPA: translational GTPase TypA [Dehalococcoidia bacterium]|nr:translational GTPase TypA [SAR202 cluster bacterium]HAL46673.1 translational GTPase TypA [Dehalococcoidia bacterium]
MTHLPDASGPGEDERPDRKDTNLSQVQSNNGIRNIAIIAHVDHGKTTLVDALLKQGQVFREHQEVGVLIMDSNPLEQERGITILAKNTAVSYNGTKINIIDTPGHADFSGEVERIMNMADGCLLLVDAVDGPMPQTRFVLQQALSHDVAPMVVINKIDRPEARVDEVEELIQDLFLELATKSEQLDFPVLYASARDGYAVADLDAPREDMQPLFEAMVESVPAPAGNPDEPFQMLVAALDYSNYLGQIAIGRIFRGMARFRAPVALLRNGDEPQPQNLEKVFVFRGLERLEVTEAQAGDIVAVSGVEGVSIGDTIADGEHPEALPSIEIDEPTVKMTFGVNTSPFMGKEGTHSTSRTLHARLRRELRTNVSLRLETTDSPDEFLVSGRGELHLTILVETMRREGHEFQVSKPEPATKVIDGKVYEPFEHLTIDTREEYIGPLTENLAGRLAETINISNDGEGNVRLEYNIPTRGLIGFRSAFLRDTRGTGVTNSLFTGFRPMSGEVKTTNNGVLIASEAGTAITYGLLIAQGRGETFVEPGTPVYAGMIVGVHPRDADIEINVCKEKKLTNMRSATADIIKRLSPPLLLSLEDALDFIADDELVEITPKNYRLRKKLTSATARQRQRRNTAKSKV